MNLKTNYQKRNYENQIFFFKISIWFKLQRCTSQSRQTMKFSFSIEIYSLFPLFIDCSCIHEHLKTRKKMLYLRKTMTHIHTIHFPPFHSGWAIIFLELKRNILIFQIFTIYSIVYIFGSSSYSQKLRNVFEGFPGFPPMFKCLLLTSPKSAPFFIF